MQKITAVLLVVTMFFILAVTAQADIIDINGKNNNILNPVVMFFEPGTYDLIPIGVEDGGAYNAVSLHYSWPATWRWQYSISSVELGTIDVNWGPYKDTEMDAFATAVSTSFTLTSGENVNFYLYDGPNGWEYSNDNEKGISLFVDIDSPSAPVPEPATMLLFGAGLVGLAGFGRKKLKY